jgi:hypothetical protein
VKRVLLITGEEVHRHLYERGLGEHFTVECATSARSASGDVDAVVYDLPRNGSTLDFAWLAKLTVPVVVLTPTQWARVPETAKRRVLVYPVRMAQILQALSKLGVEAKKDLRAEEWSDP